jgi:type IV pilus assembly protein PilM
MFGRLDFFAPKAPPLVGVDISSSSIKVLELSEAGKGQYRVERYAIEPLPREAVVDGNIANLDAAADVLRRAWRRSGSRIKNCALALPSALVITKKVIVPAGQREEDLELQVESEANQYIPFALDEVNLDYQVLGPAPSGPEEAEVLIAASRKDKVEDRVAVAQAAGLKATVMDVESMAALSAMELVESQLTGDGKNQLIAVADIGASMMRVAMLTNGQVVYTREQQVGGNQLTQEIQRHFNVSQEEAEAAKRNGGLPENYGPDVLQPFIENLALEIARALQFFFTSTQYNKVDHIVLAGGCATLPGLDEAINSRTRVNVVVANPFLKMSLSSNVKARQLTADAPALLVACGLAMRRFAA